MLDDEKKRQMQTTRIGIETGYRLSRGQNGDGTTKSLRTARTWRAERVVEVFQKQIESDKDT